jgi:hypothetical protein
MGDDDSTTENNCPYMLSQIATPSSPEPSTGTGFLLTRLLALVMVGAVALAGVAGIVFIGDEMLCGDVTCAVAG